MDGRAEGRRDGEAKTKSLRFSSKRRGTIMPQDISINSAQNVYNVNNFVLICSVILFVLQSSSRGRERELARGYKTVFMLTCNSTEYAIPTAHETKIPTNEVLSCFKSLRCCINRANKC